MRPEPAQVLAQVLAPFAVGPALRVRHIGARAAVGRGIGLFLVLAHLRQVVELPMLVVLNEPLVALPRRSILVETFRLAGHELPSRRERTTWPFLDTVFGYPVHLIGRLCPGQAGYFQRTSASGYGARHLGPCPFDS